MVKAAAFASLVSLASAGGKLSLTWEDCGTSSTHAHTTKVEPSEIVIGQDTTITSTGSTDKAITSGTFSMKLTASMGVKETYTGNLCEDKQFSMPLGMGTVSWTALGCPVAVGPTTTKIGMKMSSTIPAALAKSDLAFTAVDQDGEPSMCVNTHTKKESSMEADFESIVAEINSGNHGWLAETPAKFQNVDDVKNYLGAHLPGDDKFTAPAVLDLPPSNADLPTSFDSATQWPSCTVIANVHDQANCGSCWAFGSVSSFESRACIETGKDIKYSPEDTAFCSDAGAGCNGGNTAWSWFKETGVVTGGDYTDIGSGSTCYPYSFAPCAHHVPATKKYPKCPPMGDSPQCKNACSESKYTTDYKADKVQAISAYSLQGEQQIMQDLVENGPMFVSFMVFSDFPTYKSGVYKHTSGEFLGGHAVTLVGYGELNGEKYWKIKNSWNDQWGADGHFLIARGTNECGIESNVNAGKVASANATAVMV